MCSKLHYTVKNFLSSSSKIRPLLFNTQQQTGGPVCTIFQWPNRLVNSHKQLKWIAINNHQYTVCKNATGNKVPKRIFGKKYPVLKLFFFRLMLYLPLSFNLTEKSVVKTTTTSRVLYYTALYCKQFLSSSSKIPPFLFSTLTTNWRART